MSSMQKKLRNVFSETVLQIGPQDERLVVMVGDISHGILKPYAEVCPGRYYNIGICEPTIVNMAAGIARSGLIPVVHTIAPFIIERAYEQIKLDFGYQQLPINLVSVGSAFDYSQLGCSHHCYADLSIMSHFKRANIVFPASPLEFIKLFTEMYANGGINYFRLPEHNHGVEFTAEQIQMGRGILVREGSDLTIVAIGPQLKTALEAADALLARGVQCEVLYYHTLKPFDEELVRGSVSKTRHVLTLEAASQHGGIFDKTLRATRAINDVNYIQMAIDDFIHAYGTYAELCEEIGFTCHGIIARIEAQFPKILKICA